MAVVNSPVRSPIRSAIYSPLVGKWGDIVPLSTFTTADIVAIYSGRGGSWYDPSDISSLFQDVAGTIPVTSSGQLVALMKDRSGNGKHLSQSTSAKRPVFRQVGRSRYLDMTGTKWMSCVNFDMSGSDKFSYVSAVTTLDTVSAMLFELSTNASTNTNTFFHLLNSTATQDNFFIRGSAAGFLTSTTVMRSGAETYLTTQVIDAGALAKQHQIATRKNGVALTPTNPTLASSGNFASTQPLYFGCRNAGASFPVNGYFYGGAFIGGDVPLAAVRSVERHFGTLASLVMSAAIAAPATFTPSGDPIKALVSYGQSLSVGVLATPIENSVSRFSNTVAFVGGGLGAGPRPLDDTSDPAVAYASFAAMIEKLGGTNSNAAYGAVASSIGETPIFGASAIINELLASEGGTAGFAKLHGLATGKGSTDIAGLDRASIYYGRMIDETAYARLLSAAQSKNYEVGAVMWLQGEADSTLTTQYDYAFERLATRLNVDLKASTGQSAAIPILSYQTVGQFAIAVQQLQAANNSALIYLVGPTYHLAKSDGVHFTGVTSERWGAYVGKVYKRIAIDGIDWKPLQPLAVTYAATHIDVQMSVPVGALAIDTTIVAAVTNYGFTVKDAGAAAVTINSVTLVGSDTVRIDTASTIAAGFTVAYGETTSGGNIRDADATIYDPTGMNYRLYNWLVQFREVTA